VAGPPNFPDAPSPTLGPNDPIRAAAGYSTTVYGECELCESLRRLSESHGMCVCEDCDDRLLP